MKTFTIALTIVAVTLTGTQALKICKDQSFNGGCVTLTNAGVCNNFPGDYNDKVSSLDTQGGTCTFYVDGSCNGNSWSGVRGSYGSIPSNFNDKLSSYHC